MSSIVSSIGVPMFVDDFIKHLQGLGYARLCVKIDNFIFLKLGKKIKEKHSKIW